MLPIQRGRRQAISERTIEIIINSACHRVHAASEKGQRMKVKKTSRFRGAAFTLVEIMIVIAIIGLLAALAIPNFIRARNTTQQKTCINNLRQVDSAKHEWALENRKSDTDVPTSDELKVYIN